MWSNVVELRVAAERWDCRGGARGHGGFYSRWQTGCHTDCEKAIVRVETLNGLACVHACDVEQPRGSLVSHLEAMCVRV